MNQLQTLCFVDLLKEQKNDCFLFINYELDSTVIIVQPGKKKIKLKVKIK